MTFLRYTELSAVTVNTNVWRVQKRWIIEISLEMKAGMCLREICQAEALSFHSSRLSAPNQLSLINTPSAKITEPQRTASTKLSLINWYTKYHLVFGFYKVCSWFCQVSPRPQTWSKYLLIIINHCIFTFLIGNFFFGTKIHLSQHFT